ncbi:MAG TPA: hypothetical protein VD793_02555 [Gemmatimonadales bacterium]|nr:hypothetical protein [Gemmatimonadales bacterium]
MVETDPGRGDHPRGTLAVVALYGLVFVLGWLALYFLVYVPRGPLTH